MSKNKKVELIARYLYGEYYGTEKFLSPLENTGLFSSLCTINYTNVYKLVYSVYSNVKTCFPYGEDSILLDTSKMLVTEVSIILDKIDTRSI